MKLELVPNNYCGCSCGVLTNIHRGKSSKFISGHNRRGAKHTKETKQKTSISHLLNHGHTLKNGAIVLPIGITCGCGCGEFVTPNCRGNKLNSYVNGHNQIGKPSSFLGHKHTEESKQQTSEKLMGNTNCLGIKRPPQTKEHRRKIAKKMMGNRHKLGHKESEETLQRKSIAKKKQWSDPVWHKAQVKRMAKGSQRDSPNKKEIKLQKLLDFLYPHEWKYVGDGSVIFGTKNPDFINVNGKKQIIELFGDYWHKGQNPQDRIDVFAPFGFSTLVIWERELKHIPKLIGRIQRFTAP